MPINAKVIAVQSLELIYIYVYIYRERERNIEITPAQCGHTNEDTNKVLRA